MGNDRDRRKRQELIYYHEAYCKVSGGMTSNNLGEGVISEAELTGGAKWGKVGFALGVCTRNLSSRKLTEKGISGKTRDTEGWWNHQGKGEFKQKRAMRGGGVGGREEVTEGDEREGNLCFWTLRDFCEFLI